MRLASFRSYLAATVHSMSAIVPDVLAMAGSDVASALQRIRPAHLWPMKAAAQKTSNRRHTARLSGSRYKTSPFTDLSAAAYYQPLVGDAVISDKVPGAWIEACIFGDSLEIILRSDGYELSTNGGIAHLKLAGTLPDTVLTACVGRPVIEVVDHVMLRSGGYVIERVGKVAGYPRLSFDVGQADIDLPWRP